MQLELVRPQTSAAASDPRRRPPTISYLGTGRPERIVMARPVEIGATVARWRVREDREAELRGEVIEPADLARDHDDGHHVDRLCFVATLAMLSWLAIGIIAAAVDGRLW